MAARGGGLGAGDASGRSSVVRSLLFVGLLFLSFFRVPRLVLILRRNSRGYVEVRGLSTQDTGLDC